MPIFKIWKPVGLTPLEAIETLKEKEASLKEAKMTYAGRLDPLASGVLILLSGEDRFNKEDYLKLPKTYEVEVLFGVSTDTGDVLGLIEKVSDSEVSLSKVEQVGPTFVGKKSQTAPKFSSPSLDGKNFTKEIEIYSINIKEGRALKSETVLKEVAEKISQVAGNFRQASIEAKWQKVLKEKDSSLLVVKLEVVVSSGTYMRVLASQIGEALGVPALAYSITRLKVGDFTRQDCLDL